MQPKNQVPIDESQLISDVINSFEADIQGKPMPISGRSYPNGDHSNKNMNQTNPFIDNGGTVKQTEDDQVQTQNNFNDVGGYLPVMGERKYRLIIALWDTQQMPAGMDFPQQGAVTETNQMDSFNKEMQPKRNWQTQQTDKDLAMKEFIRNKGPQDQISKGISDPTRELWDGEQI